MQEKVIVISCPNCGKKTEIPLRVFYDGYEGPVCCSSCGEELDVDSEEE
ncbi:MAG: hypothetical protein JW727_03710 [Candidatus Aenigmarchaeota archaeon]|nr:hypothetical protein [Candidatus Aenigmarchaeota archaeon]